PVAEEAAEDGEIGPSLAAVYRDVLSGGAGMVLMEAVAVSAEGRISPGSPGLYRDDHVTPWRGIVAPRDETPAGVVLLRCGDRGGCRVGVAGSVSAAWAQATALAARASAADWARGGVRADADLAIAAEFRAGGADLLDVVAGQTALGGGPECGRAFLVPYSDP